MGIYSKKSARVALHKNLTFQIMSLGFLYGAGKISAVQAYQNYKSRNYNTVVAMTAVTIASFALPHITKYK